MHLSFLYRAGASPLPQGSTAAMTPIDNRSWGQEVVDGFHDSMSGLDHGISTLGHIEDQGLRIAGAGYGLSKLRGAKARLPKNT